MLENFSAVITSYSVEMALLGLKPWFLQLLNIFEEFNMENGFHCQSTQVRVASRRRKERLTNLIFTKNHRHLPIAGVNDPPISNAYQLNPSVSC